MRHAKRKVAFSDSKQEIVLAGFPFSKTRLKSKERSQFAACGETSTYNLTYSAVEPRHLDALPKLSVQEKEGIVGGHIRQMPEEIAEATKHGQPLFWQEYKTCDIFSSLFDDFDIGHVFDLSPGTGTAAMAASLNAIGYEGVAANHEHCQWLESVLDRASLGFIAKRDKDFKELGENIQRYFRSAVQDAKRLFENAIPEKGGAAECSAEDDDTDD
ncbi:MAG: hypothetical protein GY772_28780 [bacterium]|nr:hypothetical protein [bacterium]